MPEPSTLDELADLVAQSFEPEVRGLFLTVVAGLRERVSEDELVELLRTRNWGEILRRFQSAMSVSYIPVVGGAREVLAGIVAESARRMVTLESIELAFDLKNPAVERWIEQRAGELVTGITQDGVEAIRQVIHQGYVEGIGARAAGRLIREFVGLTPRDAGAVGRFVAEMRDQGLGERAVLRNGATYARRLRNLRAESIARTETMRATIAGQVAVWDQLLERGVLDRRRTWLRWMTTEDDRLCEFCAPMDGMKIRPGEMFISSQRGFPEGKPEGRGPGSKRVGRPLRPDPFAQPRDERGRFVRLAKRGESLDGRLIPRKETVTVPHPPLHVRCRCAVVLAFD